MSGWTVSFSHRKDAEQLSRLSVLPYDKIINIYITDARRRSMFYSCRL